MKMEFGIGRKKTVITIARPGKKLVIIIAAAVVVAVLAVSGAVRIFGGNDSQDQQPQRFGWVNDPNLPNPQKQKPQEIIAYIDSSEFKQLTPQQKMNYFRGGGQKVVEYQMEEYAALPEEEKTAYLDEIIDRMEAMRPGMEQFRQQRQTQQAIERQNNPDVQQQTQQDRRGTGGSGRRTPDPARMRARSERGTPEQRAKFMQFFTALHSRAQQRGIQMPGGSGGR